MYRILVVDASPPVLKLVEKMVTDAGRQPFSKTSLAAVRAELGTTPLDRKSVK
jgi:hypothetical protein